MRFLMTVAAIAAALSFAKGSAAFAGELDNEASVTNQAQAAKDLPATLIVRKNKKTGVVEVMHLNEKVALKGLNKAAVAKSPLFKAMGLKDKMAANGELDRDSSTSSWYFCFPNYNWSYPSYYYYGYQYSYVNYGSYDYGDCSYSYYANPYYGYGGYNGGYGGYYGGFGGGYGSYGRGYGYGYGRRW